MYDNRDDKWSNIEVDLDSSFIALAEFRGHYGPGSPQYNKYLLALQIEMLGMSDKEAKLFMEETHEDYMSMREDYKCVKAGKDSGNFRGQIVKNLDAAWKSFVFAFDSARKREGE